MRRCWERLHAKRVQGQLVSVASLGHYIRAFSTCFTNGQVPEALTLVEAMSSTTNLVAREKAHREYKAGMDAVCGPACDYVEENQIEAPHQAARESALALFSSSATFGKDEDREDARVKLEADIEETYVQMKRENGLKMDQSLVKYAPAVVIILLAFLVDKLSDYTCDWWLDTCVQASWLLLFVYVSLTGFVIYVAYELHQRRGSVAAVNGLMALGQASTRMSANYAEIGRGHAVSAYTQHVAPRLADLHAGQSASGERAKQE